MIIPSGLVRKRGGLDQITGDRHLKTKPYAVHDSQYDQLRCEQIKTLRIRYRDRNDSPHAKHNGVVMDSIKFLKTQIAAKKISSQNLNYFYSIIAKFAKNNGR